MAGSNVSAVSNYFATANEGFATTLNGSISSGATTVPLTSVSGLTNGSVFVGIIEPGAVNQQVFTGTVSTGGVSITGVKWTRGTNVAHTGGVAIVDYTTGTAFNMITTGILKQHTQGGAHTGLTTDTLSTSGNATVGGTLGVTGASTLGGAIGGAGYSMATMSNPYKFSIYRSGAFTGGSVGPTLLTFDTVLFDTNSNYSTSTGLYTVPVSGFYYLCTNMGLAMGTSVGYGATISDAGTSTVIMSNEWLSGVNSSFGHTAHAEGVFQLTAGHTIGFLCYSSNEPGIPGQVNTNAMGFLVSKT